MKSYINNVDVTDPNRNFTSAEWEKLGTMRSVVPQMREGGGRGGNTGGRSTTDSTTNRTSSVVSTNNTDDNVTAAEQSVVSEITDRGSQNGRSFGHGAYSNN